jgi:hypothetical protein
MTCPGIAIGNFAWWAKEKDNWVSALITHLRTFGDNPDIVPGSSESEIAITQMMMQWIRAQIEMPENTGQHNELASKLRNSADLTNRNQALLDRSNSRIQDMKAEHDVQLVQFTAQLGSQGLAVALAQSTFGNFECSKCPTCGFTTSSVHIACNQMDCPNPQCLKPTMCILCNTPADQCPDGSIHRHVWGRSGNPRTQCPGNFPLTDSFPVGATMIKGASVPSGRDSYDPTTNVVDLDTAPRILFDPVGFDPAVIAFMHEPQGNPGESRSQLEFLGVTHPIERKQRCRDEGLHLPCMINLGQGPGGLLTPAIIDHFRFSGYYYGSQVFIYRQLFEMQAPQFWYCQSSNGFDGDSAHLWGWHQMMRFLPWLLKQVRTYAATLNPELLVEVIKHLHGLCKQTFGEGFLLSNIEAACSSYRANKPLNEETREDYHQSILNPSISPAELFLQHATAISPANFAVLMEEFASDSPFSYMKRLPVMLFLHPYRYMYCKLETLYPKRIWSRLLELVRLFCAVRLYLTTDNDSMANVLKCLTKLKAVLANIRCSKCGRVHDTSVMAAAEICIDLRTEYLGGATVAWSNSFLFLLVVLLKDGTFVSTADSYDRNQVYDFISGTPLRGHWGDAGIDRQLVASLIDHLARHLLPTTERLDTRLADSFVELYNSPELFIDVFLAQIEELEQKKRRSIEKMSIKRKRSGTDSESDSKSDSESDSDCSP